MSTTGGPDQRPDTDPPSEKDETPAPRRPRSGCVTLLLRVAYWSATALGILGGLVLLVAAAAISSRHQSQLAEQAQPGFDAQRDVTLAQQSLEDLPSQDEADRWLSQATTVAEGVAEAQNTYLEHSGPLSLDELPEQTPGIGERDECVSYLDERPPNQRDYTNEELTACAEGLRQQAINGLDRQLTPHFAAHVRDQDGFDAVSQWHSRVPALGELEDDASEADFTWTAHEARVFERDGTIPMVWTLTHEETGQMVAWMHGTYDPVVKKFDQMVLGTVAISDDEEEDTGTDGADERAGTDGAGGDSGEDAVSGEDEPEDEGDRG